MTSLVRLTVAVYGLILHSNVIVRIILVAILVSLHIMVTPNPMAKTFPSPLPEISKHTYCIAGILTTVYGLDELSLSTRDVGCLWLLHPRLQDQSCMKPVATSTIHEWNERVRNSDMKAEPMGLIAVSFDQRNHGSREVAPIANEAWRSGNKRHAQDMFASYRMPQSHRSSFVITDFQVDGTAMDNSQLLTHLTAYIFPKSERVISNNMVLGVSLGGHAAWHCIMHDPRITSAIVIIGCPDYVRLMTDRARLSKLATWMKSSPPGHEFLGSEDFPNGLLEAVEKNDPAGLLLGELRVRDDGVYSRGPTDAELKRLIPAMKSSLQGKRVLNMSGGADKLVPYKCGAPFLKWLKNAIAPNGWFSEGNFLLEDIVFDGVGHDMSPGMVKEIHRFVVDVMERTSTQTDGRSSRM